MVNDFKPWSAKILEAVFEPLGLSKSIKLITDAAAAQRRAKALFRSFSRKLPKVYSVASLLHPERSPVPFGYRDDDLKSLNDWCYDDAHGPVLWKLVTGDTGRGKTRLLMRLVETLIDEPGRSWNAGFLDMAKVHSNPELLLYFYHLPGDFLLVIDYAERFENEVQAILRVSLALGEERPENRVRVVLISRRESEVWKKIADSDMLIGDFMGADGFTRYEPPPLGQDASTRDAIFEDAYKAYEAHFKKKRPLGKNPNLNGKGFDEAILIHLAALWLHQQAGKADDFSEETLLNWVLAREKRHWNSLIKSKGLPSKLKYDPVVQAAAYLTLVSLGAGIRNRAQAIASLRNCPLLEGLDAATLSMMAEIFHDLYPGPGWVNGVTPDLIGTYLLNITDDDFIQRVYGQIE